MTLASAIRRARKAVRAMRPRMIVGAGLRQYVVAVDEFCYQEDPRAVVKDDRIADAWRYWRKQFGVEGAGDA